MEQQLIANRYQLIERLGAGGFGEVWKARDAELAIEVALKRVKLDPGASEGDRARAAETARDEARNAAALAFHPNIVAVTNVVTDDDGLPWLAMRYIRGRTLHEALQNGPLGLDEVGRIAAALLSALGAAHAARLVHRDVKPGNIMVAADGGVFLTDFGIARRQDGTVTNSFAGSVGYAAPERFNHKDFGAPNGPAGDLFSVGATLYHAIEGRPPFEPDPDATSVGAVLHAVCYEPHPPMVRAGHLTPLIEALLAKRADDRPSIAQAQAMLTAKAVRKYAPPPWQTMPNTLGPSPTVSLDEALPKPDIAAQRTEPVRPRSTKSFWSHGAPILLVIMLMLALFLPGASEDRRFGAAGDADTVTNHYHFPVGQLTATSSLFFLPWIGVLTLLAGCLLTAVATIRLQPSSTALRGCGYCGVPASALLFVLCLTHPALSKIFPDSWPLLLDTRQVWGDGDGEATFHVGGGILLIYVIFMVLFGLYVARDISLRRHRSELT